MRRPTIKDVAAQAGVSKSTVSLVLRASPAVHPDTARQVREAMAAVGYVYNRAAAGLRAATGGLIGLVINDLRNPFFTEFAASLQMALAADGYATVIANADEDPRLQAGLLRSMIEHGVSALVISPSYGGRAADFAPVAGAGVPCLQVLRRGEAEFPFASFDYADGGRQAVRHLWAQGARRIAFVGGVEDRAITIERRSGYLSELAALGGEAVCLHGPASRGFGFEMAAQLQADAAVCFNDLVALGLLAGFARRGVTVGGPQMRIIGFDDIEEARQATPPLSSIACDIARFGRDTAAALLGWLREGARPPAEYRAPVQLIARASSTG